VIKSRLVSEGPLAILTLVVAAAFLAASVVGWTKRYDRTDARFWLACAFIAAGTAVEVAFNLKIDGYLAPTLLYLALELAAALYITQFFASYLRNERATDLIVASGFVQVALMVSIPLLSIMPSPNGSFASTFVETTLPLASLTMVAWPVLVLLLLAVHYLLPARLSQPS
jgi:hypothetical protein